MKKIILMCLLIPLLTTGAFAGDHDGFGIRTALDSDFGMSGLLGVRYWF